MIEKIITKIIQDLGPTGLLVLGLYFVIGRYLKDMTTHISKINDEVGEIKNLLKWQKP